MANNNDKFSKPLAHFLNGPVRILDEFSVKAFEPGKLDKEGKKVVAQKFETKVTLDFSNTALEDVLDLAADSVIIKLQSDWRTSDATERKVLQDKYRKVVNVAEYANKERRKRDKVEAGTALISTMTVKQAHAMFTKVMPVAALEIESNVKAGKYGWDDPMPVAAQKAETKTA